MISGAVAKLTPVVVESYSIFEKTGASLSDREVKEYILSTGFITEAEYSYAAKPGTVTRSLGVDEVRIHNEAILRSVLTQEQQAYTNKLVLRAKSGRRDFDDIYYEAKCSLSSEDYIKLEYVMMATEVLIYSLDNFKGGTMPSALRASFLERFSCGVVTGGIGSVWGTMVGGILTLSMAVPAANVIGGAVAIVAGAAIGTALC